MILVDRLRCAPVPRWMHELGLLNVWDAACAAAWGVVIVGVSVLVFSL